MAEENHFPEIIEALHRAAAQSVAKCAFDIEARAKASAPVDTGALKNSIYAVTAEGGDGPQGDLPPIEPPTDDQTAYVAVGMSYGIFVELGTSHAPAQPYLIPAAEGVAPSFRAAMAAIGDKLAEYGVK